MIISTADSIPGKRIIEVLGVARGNTIRCRHVGKDIVAMFKNIVGGEVEEYTKMLAESREQAIDRMIESAQSLGANAIVAMRIGTSSVMQGAAEIVAYGTAVLVDNE